MLRSTKMSISVRKMPCIDTTFQSTMKSTSISRTTSRTSRQFIASCEYLNSQIDHTRLAPSLQPSFRKPRVHGVTLHAYRSILVGSVSRKALLGPWKQDFQNYAYPTARGHIAPKKSIPYARQSMPLSMLIKILFLTKLLACAPPTAIQATETTKRPIRVRSRRLSLSSISRRAGP